MPFKLWDPKMKKKQSTWDEMGKLGEILLITSVTENRANKNSRRRWKSLLLKRLREAINAVVQKQN